MNGRMGALPDWYPLITAARYLGVAPWDLLEHSSWWQDKAHIANTAEQQAAEEKRKHPNY
ncbi:MAG: hypothetical protein ACRDHW_00865 [Ktedonobacteraceae bacterium]